MPSFSDSVFLFILALLLFGPKKLPVLARELGKWVGEFRRASNEFKMQMEDELRLSEQAERQKKIAAMEAAAPVAPALASEAEGGLAGADTDAQNEPAPADGLMTPLPIASSGELNLMPPATGLPTPRGGRMSGEEQTESPAYHGNTDNGHSGSDALGGLIGSIPEAQTQLAANTGGGAPQLSEIEEYARENALHGD